MSYKDYIVCPCCQQVIGLEVDIEYGGIDNLYANINPIEYNKKGGEMKKFTAEVKRVGGTSWCSIKTTGHTTITVGSNGVVEFTVFGVTPEDIDELVVQLVVGATHIREAAQEG